MDDLFAPFFVFRGMSRLLDVLECLNCGDLIVVHKKRPAWWPWRIELKTGDMFGPRVFLTDWLFTGLFYGRLIEVHQETERFTILRMSPDLADCN